MQTSLDQIQNADDLVNSVKRQTTVFTGVARLLAGLKELLVRKLGTDIYTGDRRNQIDAAFDAFSDGKNQREFEGKLLEDPKSFKASEIVAKVKKDVEAALEGTDQKGVDKSVSEVFAMANDERMEDAFAAHVPELRRGPVETGSDAAESKNRERGEHTIGGVKPTHGREQSKPGKVGH